MNVTAIMPTRGRNVWAAIAVDSFLRQTYPWKQLIILDDRNDPSFTDDAEPPTFDGVSYLRHDSSSIAFKRNLLCEVASSGVICHWDDDDYSDPGRMADQVKRLEESNVGVTGYCSMLFYDIATGRAMKYVNDGSYALGTSLMYTREFWKAHPFKDQEATPNIGEDNHFVGQARDGSQLASVDAGQFMVARTHPGNTSFRDVNRPGSTSFHAVPVESIPRGFFR